METDLRVQPRLTVPRALRAHPFITLLVVGALVGGGLRFVPTSSAGASAANGQTACAAK